MSRNKNVFDTIRVRKPGKSTFDLSHDVKMSMKFNNLYPILTQECLPGDKFDLGFDSLIRLAPMVAPVMHKMNVSIHCFFVPNRIIFKEWESFISRDETVPHPYINLGVADTGSGELTDYMGVPPIGIGKPDVRVNALPFAAYQAVYNEYFRDQNLIPEVNYQLQPGDNAAIKSNLLTMRKRAWEHDYYTSCLPTSQLGDVVNLPLGGLINPNFAGPAQLPVLRNDATPGQVVFDSTTPGEVLNMTNQVADGSQPVGTGEGFIDLSDIEVGPTTITDLRRAFRVQEWAEKAMRAGRRLYETLLVHFGVRSQDARIQRPEYITGVKTPVIVSEVLNTTGETDGLPQGNMSGHGIAVTSGRSGQFYCPEWGWIVAVVSVIPNTAYEDGLDRKFRRFDPFDYFWNDFENIGEQAVLNREVNINHDDPDGTFGYNPRYSEYKYAPSRVAGQFRVGQSLDDWHMGRSLPTNVALNQDFVEASATTRIFAVQDDSEDYLWCQFVIRNMATRSMSYFGDPMM